MDRPIAKNMEVLKNNLVILFPEFEHFNHTINSIQNPLDDADSPMIVEQSIDSSNENYSFEQENGFDT